MLKTPHFEIYLNCLFFEQLPIFMCSCLRFRVYITDCGVRDIKLMPHARRAPTPACPPFAEAASRRQAKRHFGVQARKMKNYRIADTDTDTDTLFSNERMMIAICRFVYFFTPSLGPAVTLSFLFFDTFACHGNKDHRQDIRAFDLPRLFHDLSQGL